MTTRESRLSLPRKWLDTFLGFVIALFCLVLYLRTLAPGVLGGDAGELQFVPYILSLAHPTGYPLHTLLGKAWTTLVPFGSIAYRMNLLSAVAAASAVGVIYGTVWRSTRSWPAAIFAALLLGASEVFWGQAIIADKYALNALLTALVLLTLAWWSEAPHKRDLTWCAVAYGTSLTHHRSMLVFFPLLVGYWAWRDPRLVRNWRYLIKTAFAMGMPLLLYLWLPLGAARGLPPGTWRPTSLEEWTAYFLDRGFLSAVEPQVGLVDNVGRYGKALIDQFTILGVLLGLAGLARQIRMRNPLGAFLVPGFLLQAVLPAGYQVPRQWVFFLPSYIILSLWVGEGLAWLFSMDAVFTNRRKVLRRAMTGLTLLSAAALVLFPLPKNYLAFREAHLDGATLDIWRQDLKSGYLAQRFVENSLPLVEPDSIIVADWEQATPLWYFQQVEGWRPDVSIVYPIERWAEALESGRPTYLTRSLDGVGRVAHLTGVGSLAKVTRVPEFRIPASVTPTAISWEGQIELVGYHLYQVDCSAGYVIPLSLYFRALRQLGVDYSFSIRLFAEDGQKIWAQDRRDLVLGMYPSSRWSQGEVVGDYFEIPLPRRLPTGEYHVGIIVYSQNGESIRNLTVSASGDNVAYLPSLDVRCSP